MARSWNIGMTAAASILSACTSSQTMPPVETTPIDGCAQVTGTYSVVPSIASGDCGPAGPTSSWSFSDVESKDFVLIGPAGGTVTSGPFLDGCHLAYTASAPDSCPGVTSYSSSFALTFTDAGFTGDVMIQGCGAEADGGPTNAACTGTYELTGTRTAE